MRHAVEQVTMEKNWLEKTVLDEVEWTCGWNRKCYEVVRRARPDRSWDVVVRRRRTRKSLRRISELCVDETTKGKAEEHCRRVLQDFVLGRLR
jgi:hypothetical protein